MATKIDIYLIILLTIGVTMLLTGSHQYESTNYQKATFAGGCFWCMQLPFDKLPGVISVSAGYIGGYTEKPTYPLICNGDTGHAEAIEIVFDPGKITFSELLDIFWRQIDPTDKGGQFFDRGDQYRTAIFFHNEEQKQLAEKSKEDLEKSGRFTGKIVTEIVKASTFNVAEDYHQNYYKTNAGHYQRYRSASGRDRYLAKIWGNKPAQPQTGPGENDPQGRSPESFIKPSSGELKEILTPQQYYVTQEEGTEPPFENTFWDNKSEGIYVDIVSGEPLFSSTDKFDSGTGWPSFTRPIKDSILIEKEDRRLLSVRTEVRSSLADSHLGHLFTDGPAPTGLRYCINSAALRFIHKNKMKQGGYGEYLDLFEK